MNKYHKIYSVEQLPVFQNKVFSSEIEAKNCVKGDVDLVQDKESGLIFNKSFNPKLMNYDADYQNEQAFSSVFKQHLENISEILNKHFFSKSLLEVGCGKGYFLELLQSKGFNITGLDPTYTGNNSSIKKEYFSPEIGCHADGIILRHVLEHVQEPVKFLLNICEANSHTGQIYIEVPCFDWICKHGAWFDIFYEHVNYFRIQDFYQIFGKIIESGHVFNGQYLYVIADLDTIKTSFQGNHYFELPQNFLDTINQFVVKLKKKKNTNCKKLTTAIWGGSSKGVIFALYMQRAGIKIDIVIDINPIKQGKYLAGTGLKVCSPEFGIKNLDAEADILVMNSNYLSEIQVLTKNQFNYILVES